MLYNSKGTNYEQTLLEGKYTFVFPRQHPFSNFKRTKAGKMKGISEAKNFWVSQ